MYAYNREVKNRFEIQNRVNRKNPITFIQRMNIYERVEATVNKFHTLHTEPSLLLRDLSEDSIFFRANDTRHVAQSSIMSDKNVGAS